MFVIASFFLLPSKRWCTTWWCCVVGIIVNRQIVGDLAMADQLSGVLRLLNWAQRNRQTASNRSRMNLTVTVF